MADLDHADQSAQSSLFNFALAQELRIVKEIPQEPAQLPHRLGSAVQAPGNRISGKRLRFKDRELQGVERLLGMPTILGTLDADEVDAIGNGDPRFLPRLCQTSKPTLHATTSLRDGA